MQYNNHFGVRSEKFGILKISSFLMGNINYTKEIRAIFTRFSMGVRYTERSL